MTIRLGFSPRTIRLGCSAMTIPWIAGFCSWVAGVVARGTCCPIFQENVVENILERVQFRWPLLLPHSQYLLQSQYPDTRRVLPLLDIRPRKNFPKNAFPV